MCGWNAVLTFPDLAFNYLWIATPVAIQQKPHKLLFFSCSILHSCHAGISAPFASLLTQIVPFHAMLLCVCKGCWMTTSAAVPRFVNPHFLLNTKVQISPNYHRFVWIKGLHSCEFQKAEEWIPGKQKHQ